MNKEDAHIVIAMANHNKNVTDVARAIFRTQKYRSLSLGQGEAAGRVRPSAVL